MKPRRALPLLLALLSLFFLPARASSPVAWTREGASFRVGTFEGMVVTPSGFLAPGPARTAHEVPGGTLAWDVLAGKDGDVFLAGGAASGLWVLGRDGFAEIGGLEGEPEILALARGRRGRVYLATGPGGAVYRLDREREEAIEVFRPEATYVWDLLPTGRGTLLVATGLPGRVLEVDPEKGTLVRVLWESPDPHVRCLARDREGRILAGTAGSGLLVRLAGDGGAFVLWDSPRPETVAIVPAPDGGAWVAFAGKPGEAESGGTGERPRKENRRTKTVSITVKPAATAGEGDDKGGEKETGPSRAAELPGGGGELVHLPEGGEPRVAWKDKKETPLALAPAPGGGVLLATGTPARVWWFDEREREGLWDERPGAKAFSALATDGDRVLAATSHPAALLVYGPGPASPARWTSDVLDARVRARFGRVHAVTSRERTADVRVLVRAGNTSVPGEAWTEWIPVNGAAGPPEVPGEAVRLPLARFFQVRVEARGERPLSPTVRRLVARYRPVNRPPRVEKVEALPLGVAWRPLPPPKVASGERPVIPPPRNPDAARALGNEPPKWRSKKAWEPGALTIRWSARDPDGDPLRYELAACRDDGGPCRGWRVLARDLARSFHSFDSRDLPDGTWRFRVVATDEEANPLGEGRTAEAESDPVVIDHRPPEIGNLSWEKGAPVLEFVVVDPGGRVGRVEVSLTPGKWRALAPEDGVEDGDREDYRLELPAEFGGDGFLVRAVDGAGNATTRRVAVPAR